MPFIYSVSEAACLSGLCKNLSAPIITVNFRHISASVIESQCRLLKI